MRSTRRPRCGPRRFARLRTFAEFWPTAKEYACCLTASDEEVDADPGAFDCDVCPIAEHLGELEADPANASAWALFQAVIGRFTVDTHLAHVVLEKLTADLGPEDFAELMDRFAILYDAICPPPKQEPS